MNIMFYPISLIISSCLILSVGAAENESVEYKFTKTQLRQVLKAVHYANLFLAKNDNFANEVSVNFSAKIRRLENLVSLIGEKYEATIHLDAGCILGMVSRIEDESEKKKPDYVVSENADKLAGLIKTSHFMQFSGLEQQGIIFELPKADFNDAFKWVQLPRYANGIPVEREYLVFSFTPSLENLSIHRINAIVSFEKAPTPNIEKVIKNEEVKNKVLQTIKNNVTIKNTCDRLSKRFLEAHFTDENTKLTEPKLAYVHVSKALENEDYDRRDDWSGELKLGYVVECSNKSTIGTIYLDAYTGDIIGGVPFRGIYE